MIRVERLISLTLRTAIGLEDEFHRSCQDATEVSGAGYQKQPFQLAIRTLDNEGEGEPLSVAYLSRLCARFPNVHSIELEDCCTKWEKDGTELLKSIKNPLLIE